MKEKKILIYWLLPLAGTAFILWYIRSATCDVVYSDYIRLVNSYLPDVWNLKKFLVPDVLTRIPVNYLARIINVELLGFSVTFDRMLGAAALGLAGGVLARYCWQRSLGLVWFLLSMAVMFSLNKWEMLTNGSGWAHFLAFACFYYHYLVLDRIWTGEEKKRDRIRMWILPWVITLGVAGPYCAVYTAVLLIACVCCMAVEHWGREKKPWNPIWLGWALSALIPLILYMISNSFAVEEHAGATGRTLAQILGDHPDFPVRFLLKSFAAVVIGGEELTALMEAGVLTDGLCYGLGLLVLAGYAWALWLNARLRLYRKSIFPLMLLAGGLMNHLLIFFSRYIFEQENYAMSSRYTLQFQVGILGMILTFALAFQAAERGKYLARTIMALFCLAILAGNGYTTYRELEKAPYREERFEQMVRELPQRDQMTDEYLGDLVEYHKGRDQIDRAFDILEENHLNLYRTR